jgi:amino acid transporter
MPGSDSAFLLYIKFIYIYIFIFICITYSSDMTDEEDEPVAGESTPPLHPGGSPVLRSEGSGGSSPLFLAASPIFKKTAAKLKTYSRTAKKTALTRS